MKNTANETADLIGTQQELIPNSNNTPIEIPIVSVKGISEEQVSILCRKVIGEKDNNTSPIYKGFNTDFELSYLCDGAIECRGVQYYVVRMSWLVDNNHWSYIGDLIVSANGYEIYSGLKHSDGTYSFGQMLWSSPLNDSNKQARCPMDSVKGISEEDALELCYTKLGEKDETVGFTLKYRYVAAVELNEQSYYVVSRSYNIHEEDWSDMGIVMVSSNGNVML